MFRKFDLHQAVCWVIVAIGICSGIRWSELLLERRPRGTIYDTRHEQWLGDDQRIPLLEVWREDAPVYAEPVAICGWQDGISTWQFHFATNRRPEAGSAGRIKYGNESLAAPQFGRARVTLPRRRRGVDIPLTSLGSQPQGDHSQAPEPVPATEVIESVTPATWEQFLAGVSDQIQRSRQQDLLLFVHGFNVSFDASLVRTAQIALDMPFNGAVVAYSWPSQGGIQNYSNDEPVNAAAVAPFQEFLNRLRDGVPSGTRIHIVVHSMGNRIVLRAIASLTNPALLRRATPKPPPIGHLALMAPDVGLADFQMLMPLVIPQCERVSLYTSRFDLALVASRRLHSEQRAGDGQPPLILSGLETIDCSAIDGTSCLGHSYYSSSVDVLADLFQLIKWNRPAGQRSHLSARTGWQGQYWTWTATAPRDHWTWHFDHLPAVTTVDPTLP